MLEQRKTKMQIPKISLDDLFSTQEQRDNANLEKIINIKIDDIDDFPNHPFKIIDNEEMENMKESIIDNGVLVPALVRQKANGRYEMISGHRRKFASELAQKETLPCIVRDLSDDEAIIIMVDSNMQREEILPSEKAIQTAKETAKATARGIKLAIKATISAIKGIIAGTKALIAALIAGGWVAIVVIIIICLVALLVSSIFGIFFSGEKTSSNSITMNQVVAECNMELSNKLQEIQDKNAHDDYVLEGNMTSWKDILLIYTVKQSNGNNQTEVITIDDNKKAIIKKIFWEMNSITYEVKTEKVVEQGVNTNELPQEVEKKVLHIRINSKNAEQMKSEYNFNALQIKQYNELSDPKYASLWSGAIYGSVDSGEYVNWRQAGQSWSSIKIGNTNSNLGQIGCLVTSISILIEKSGCNTTIVPFNPGTFLEALNKNNAFDENGNLQYAGVTKAVPNFKYVGNVNLRGKSREEKLSLIKQYYNAGYYLTIEVKGATPHNQHWVAITGINGNNVIIVDPARDGNDLWSLYEWNKSSQFNYFSAN